MPPNQKISGHELFCAHILTNIGIRHKIFLGQGKNSCTMCTFAPHDAVSQLSALSMSHQILRYPDEAWVVSGKKAWGHVWSRYWPNKLSKQIVQRGKREGEEDLGGKIVTILEVTKKTYEETKIIKLCESLITGVGATSGSNCLGRGAIWMPWVDIVVLYWNTFDSSMHCYGWFDHMTRYDQARWRLAVSRSGQLPVLLGLCQWVTF